MVQEVRNNYLAITLYLGTVLLLAAAKVAGLLDWEWLLILCPVWFPLFLVALIGGACYLGALLKVFLSWKGGDDE